MEGGDVICVIDDVTALGTVKLCTVTTVCLRTLRIGTAFPLRLLETLEIL